MDEPESLDAWFAREILVHEAALVRYLARIWPNRQDLHDLRQEVYVRVYEAAGKSRPYAAKSFLFTSARHLILDRIRRNRVVSIEAVADTDALNVLIDELTPEHRVGARQELKRLAQGFDQLPPKCREVVWMRKVDELSQREVAQRLSIHERTVEKHVTKGVRLLADYLFGSREKGRERLFETEESEPGNEHGQQHQD